MLPSPCADEIKETKYIMAPTHSLQMALAVWKVAHRIWHLVMAVLTTICTAVFDRCPVSLQWAVSKVLIDVFVQNKNVNKTNTCISKQIPIYAGI